MALSRKYYISDFNKETDTICVTFTQYNYTQYIVVPIYNEKYITGQDLDNYIMSFCPIIPEVKAKKSIVHNADYIDSLVDKIKQDKTIKYNKKLEAISLRHELLKSSDWTELPDANKTLTEDYKILWNKYRQDLRDITEQPGWPLDIVWPKRPYILGVTIF